MSATFTYLLDGLGWALLHSIWQGGVAFILVVSLRFALKNNAPSLRYILQTAVLIGCFLAFLFTLAIYLRAPDFSAAPTDTLNIALVSPLNPQTPLEQIGLSAQSVLPSITEYTPLIALLWCLGFAFMVMKYMAAYALTQRLRQTGLSEPTAIWQAKFDQLLRASRLNAGVKLYISKYVDGPMTLGFIKPIVLVPVGFLTRLPGDQVEAILLHEIAHIRRYDYAVNLVQTAIRTVFFYHPAIHYISKRIDIDREQACDDFAFARTENPQSLIKGLAALSFNMPPNLAMAAAKKDMPILARLKRLTGYNETYRRPEHAIISALTAVVIGVGYVGTVTSADAHPPIEPNPPIAPISTVAELPETVINRRYNTLPKLPELQQLPNLDLAGQIDKTRFKTHLKNDSNIWKTISKDLESFEYDLKLYMKSNPNDEAAVEALAEQAEAIADKYEDEFEIRREIMEERYEAYVEAHEEKAQHEDLQKDTKNRLRDHQAFRNDVMENLLNDGLIQSKSETVFLSHPNNKMSLNGKALAKGLAGKYCKILEKNGIYDNHVEVTIKPHSIQVLTDYNGEEHKTKITYGEWEHEDAKHSHKEKHKYKETAITKVSAQPQSYIDVSDQKSYPVSYVWPSESKKVSAEFGLKNKMWPQSHKGIDIPAPTGTPVYASAEGFIKAVYEDKNYGKTIMIRHPDGRTTLYSHLNSFRVEHGQTVKMGQIIGKSGNTGKSTGPHLHFEVRENGYAVNPRRLLGS